MRTINRIAFLLCAGLILFGSCKKSVPPQLKAIPGNAVFVVGLENKKLMEKGGLNNLKDFKLFQKMREKLSAENPERWNTIDKYLTNLKSSGLDLDQSYIFGLKQSAGFYVAFSFKVDNLVTLESNSKELALIGDGEEAQVEDKGAYKIVLKDESAFAWNKDLFFVVAGTDCRSVNFDELFNMPEDKSIVSVPDFADFMKRSYDIGFWMPYGIITDVYSDILKMELPDMYKDLADAFIHAYLNFENGEMKVSGLMTPKSKVDAFMAKYPVIKKDFNTTLLNAFPDKSYLAMKLSVNVLEYFKMIAEVTKQMDAGTTFDQMILDNPTVNTVVNALGGDMLLSIYGFAQGPLPIPLAGLCFTVKSKEDFDKLLALVPEGMVKPSGEHYVISTGMVASIYIAYKDNKAYITDDADAIASFMGKGFDKNMTSSPMSGALKKSPSLVYINLDIDSYPENIRTLLQNEGGANVGTFLNFLRPYKDITISMVSDYEGVFSLKMKDASQNSLKQILKSWDEVAAAEVENF